MRKISKYFPDCLDEIEKYIKEKTDKNLPQSERLTQAEVAKELSDRCGQIISTDIVRKYMRDVLKIPTDEKKNSFKNKTQFEDENELKKERMKLQVLNMERNRINRNEARFELFYEQIGNAITTLPLPEFEEIDVSFKDDFKKEYLLCLADIHYGAEFESENNIYSREEVKIRLEFLQDKIIDWCNDKKVTHLHIASLGDLLQGLLRPTDLQINDTSVVQCVVEISRLIALFLNNLSKYIEIDYYHITKANHTQTRPIGTKANQLADEDLEFVIGNYIKDLLINNDRIKVHLMDHNKSYMCIDILGFEIVLSHGHWIKNISNALRDISMLRRSFVDYLILGHYHSGKEVTSNEGVCNDCELLIAPSFIGSDPFSDSLLKGSKGSVKIYGFDEIYGHTETYKFILN